MKSSARRDAAARTTIRSYIIHQGKFLRRVGYLNFFAAGVRTGSMICKFIVKWEMIGPRACARQNVMINNALVRNGYNLCIHE